jgi:hypothetical protein
MSKNEDVDPAALLIAIVPFASTPLTEEGAWHWLNTILAGAVLTVLVAYTCVGARRRPRPAPERVAIGTVIGLVAAIASAYPLQSLLAGNWNSDEIGKADPHIDQATVIGLLVGLVVAGVVFRLLRYDAPDTEAPSV